MNFVRSKTKKGDHTNVRFASLTDAVSKSKSATKSKSKSKKRSSAKKKRSRKKSGKASKEKGGEPKQKSVRSESAVAIDGSTLLPEPTSEHARAVVAALSAARPKTASDIQHPKGWPVEADEAEAKTESPPPERSASRPSTSEHTGEADAMMVDAASADDDHKSQGSHDKIQKSVYDIGEPEDTKMDKLDESDAGLWSFFGPGVALAGSVAAGAVFAYQSGMRPW